MSLDVPATPTAELSSRLRQLELASSQLDQVHAGRLTAEEYLLDADLAGPHRSTPFAHGAAGADQLLRQLRPVLAALPEGEEGISRPRTGLRIALIAERHLVHTLEGAAELVHLAPTAWRGALDAAIQERPDLLLVAPVQEGRRDAWKGAGDPGTYVRRRITGAIMPAFREAGIPVVFWGTQETRFYDDWVDVAQQADHVLTVAEELVERYAADCPRARTVEVMRPAVNPLLHSPLGTRPASAELVTYAGTWHAKLFPQRREYAAALLDGVIRAGRRLVLLDPRSQAATRDDRFSYPRGFTPYLASRLGPKKLIALHRAADAAIALNSTVASQTACSPTALTLQACGTAVLSTYNQGLSSAYPHVHLAQSAEDVAAHLETLPLEELRRIQAAGLRTVFLHDHVVDRLHDLASVAGVDAGTARPAEPRVLAVADRITPELSHQLHRQSIGPVELVTWEQAPARAGTVEMLLPVSPERAYGPEYAADHLAAFAYQSAPVTTKLEGPAESADRWAHRRLDGDAAPLELTAWWRPEPALLANRERLRAARREFAVYAIDHGEHGPADGVLARSAAPRDRDDDAAAVAVEVRRRAEQLGLRLTVIVPVYNNGSHLRHKGFASLRRSALFSQMQVLLIDDGSTDAVTATTVDELAAEHPNVTAYHFAPGGSGSASRPRNLGIQLTATEYVAYLDPDDEMVCGGLARLVEELDAHPEADLAMGNVLRWSTRRLRIDHHQELQEVFGESADDTPAPDAAGTLVLPKDSLARWGFRSLRIHAAVIRTSWLQPLDLQMPLGALGQDNYLSQQMLHHARRIRTVDVDVNAYYSEVTGSAVNAVSPRYFARYLPLEQDRVAWLREEGLLEDYRRTRLEGYVVNWYLKKLGLVSSEQWREAAEHIAEILALYEDGPWTRPEIDQFLTDLRTAVEND
ncbi:glycosyltransferase family A protein [Nesterenkonia sp. CL21]|uniref:glycosyltransferase family A protein n=1 Tax=Nesterenkonia sp. CL21 TaxID=3064894 RepID=UPI002878569C|nr:glycosyltransferase family A protein [Nesterenkonia sp. CL21]MDS2174068.1 glycosyltransferase family A protein [Nesterenkonia sp. CL21]